MSKFTFIKKVVFATLLVSVSLNAYSDAFETRFNQLTPEQQEEFKKLDSETQEAYRAVFNNCDWYYVVGFENDNKLAVIIPTEQNIFHEQPSPNKEELRNVWVYYVNKNKQLKYDFSEVYEQVNCKTFSHRFLSLTNYLKGKQIDHFTYLENSSNKFQYMPPNSLGAETIKFVCNIEKHNFEDDLKTKHIIPLPKDPVSLVKQVQQAFK